jgi:hypothetical protein
MILVWTDHPCLRVGRHRWYLSHYGYNTSSTVLFLKTAVRIRIDAHIRTIVVLTGGKLIGIYFLHLLSITMHRRQGNMVSILPPGDVNLGDVPSRWGSLEDSPYHAVGAVMSHDRTPTACGDLGMFCGHLRMTWIRSCNICSAVHVALNVWVPPGD